jgi:hypothetical protein
MTVQQAHRAIRAAEAKVSEARQELAEAREQLDVAPSRARLAAPAWRLRCRALLARAERWPPNHPKRCARARTGGERMSSKYNTGKWPARDPLKTPRPREPLGPDGKPQLPPRGPGPVGSGNSPKR